MMVPDLVPLIAAELADRVLVELLILASLHLSWCYSKGIVDWVWVGLLHLQVLPMEWL